MRTLGSGGRSGTVICTGMTLVTGRKRERDPAAAAAKAPRACGQLASEVAVFTALLEPGEERLQPLSAATGSERSFTLDSAFLHSGLARAAWCTLGSRGWSLAWRCLFEGFQKKKKGPPRVKAKVTAQWNGSFWVLSESFCGERGSTQSSTSVFSFTMQNNNNNKTLST